MQRKRNYIKNLKLSEISMVDNPAQAGAVATILKAAETHEQFVARVCREAAESLAAPVVKAEEAPKAPVSTADQVQARVIAGQSEGEAIAVLRRDPAFIAAYEREETAKLAEYHRSIGLSYS